LLFCKETLCDKYLESTKVYSDANTSSVILLVFAFTLRLIKPFIPSFIDELESRLWLDRWDYSIFDFKDFELAEKNYKINLFMDIVDKLKKLKSKIWSRKHESINVFVQANPEFLSFLWEAEDLLKSLVNISELNCLRLHEETPSDYELENVLNINIWIKSNENSEVKKDILVDLKLERSEKIEHLQHLKSLVASVLQSWNTAIILQKKLEIKQLQSDIESLDFEIRVLKSK
jgi:valyl-tRNA synthetase